MALFLLITALVGATGTMGTMIVKGTLDSTETVSRDLASAEKVFSDTSDANQNETDDELYFVLLQKQKVVELQKDKLRNRVNSIPWEYVLSHLHFFSKNLRNGGVIGY